jgi:hypothetical protein
MRIPYYFFLDSFPPGMDLAGAGRIFDMTPDYPQPLMAGMIIHKRVEPNGVPETYRILEVHAGITILKSSDNCFYVLVEKV